jgi:sugar O-acyltransferase (sialic acid O-acetyltransferase NeuD family)
MLKKIVIYGCGAFAKLMHYYFSTANQYEVVAFTVDSIFLQDTFIYGLPVIPFEDITDDYPPSDFSMFVAIGYQRMRNRKILFEKAKNKQYLLVNYISSKAIAYHNLVLGENNVIMGNVNIEPFVKIGDHNIVWSDTLLGHDLVLGNYNYVAAKCLLAGNSIIGDLCFFGNGVTTIDHLMIANETYLVAGSVLFKDTKPYMRYFGNPAKPFRKSHEDYGIIITR